MSPGVFLWLLTLTIGVGFACGYIWATVKHDTKKWDRKRDGK